MNGYMLQKTGDHRKTVEHSDRREKKKFDVLWLREQDVNREIHRQDHESHAEKEIDNAMDKGSEKITERAQVSDTDVQGRNIFRLNMYEWKPKPEEERKEALNTRTNNSWKTKKAPILTSSR